MSNTTIPRYPAPATVSEQARAVLAAAPTRHQYPPLEDTTAWLAHVRGVDTAHSSAIPEAQPGIHQTERLISRVRTFVHHPEGTAHDWPVVMDLHPGGLIYLGGELCRRLGSMTAAAMGMETWSPDYRMPPLHPYPAALDDCVSVYEALVEVHSAARIVVRGVSAGGNLAAAMMLRAKEEGLPMPAALVLGTPEVDLTESGDSFVVNRDADNTLSSCLTINHLYAGGEDLRHPYLSPLFGDLAGLPPTLVWAGTRDLFLSNAVRMHRALRGVGVDAELHVLEAMPHSGFGGSPEDEWLAREVRRFIHAHCVSG